MNWAVDPDSTKESASPQGELGNRLSISPTQQILETHREATANRA
jgi:hypothetical protein